MNVRPSYRLMFREYQTILPIDLHWSPYLETAHRRPISHHPLVSSKPMILRVEMFKRRGRTTRLNPTIVPPLSEPQSFQHKANIGRLFVTAGCSELNARTHDGIASAPQSFANALQELHDSDERPEPETPTINYTRC